MTSKNLFINFQKCEHAQRTWTLWLLLYLAAMSVLSFTFEMLSVSDYQTVSFYLLGVPDLRSLFFTVFSAIFCGIHGFLYLHSAKKSDFFLSLPLSRKQLFFSTYLNGIYIYLLPFTAYKLISFFIADISGQLLVRKEALLNVSLSLLISFLGFLAIYHTVILGMLLCGKLAYSFLTVLILLFYGSYAVILPIELYCREFFQTFYRSDLLLTLKDTVSPFCLYHSLIQSAENGNWQFSAHFPQFILLLFFCIFSLGIAIYLFQRRPAEFIGTTLAFPSSAICIRPLLTVPAALFCGLFLQKSAPDPSSPLWTFAGILIGGITTHALLQTCFLGTRKSFLQNKVSLFITLAVSAITASIFLFDLFSYDRFLPSREALSSMAVNIDGLDTNDTYSDSTDTVLQNMKLTKASLKNAYTWCESLSETTEISGENYTSAVVLYRTSSGKNIYRRYPVSTPDKLLAFDPVYTSSEYKKGVFPLLSGIGHTAKRNLIWSDGISTYVLDLHTNEKEELLSIYSEEMNALSLHTLQTEFPCGSLTLSYPRTDNGDSGLIYPSFHRTIDYLKTHQIPAQNTLESYELIRAEKFRVLENGYRASEQIYESESAFKSLVPQLVIRDFAVNPLLYPVNLSCEILIKAKSPTSGSVLETECALKK